MITSDYGVSALILLQTCYESERGSWLLPRTIQNATMVTEYPHKYTEEANKVAYDIREAVVSGSIEDITSGWESMRALIGSGGWYA